MSLKVCILSPKMPWPPRDGGALAVLSLATGLAALGAEVSLLACNTHKHYFSVDKLPKEITTKLQIHAVEVNTRIKPLKALRNLLFSQKPYVAQRFESKAFEQKLISLLQAENYDIVQLESPYMGAYLHIVREHTNAKIILRTHNIEHEIWKRRARQNPNPLLKWYFLVLSRRIKGLELEIARQSDALLPITRRDGYYFRQMAGTDKQLVCPIGLDRQVFEQAATKTKEEKNGLFYIGALDWGPNQEGIKWFLDKVWPILQRTGEAQMHIAGRNAPRALKNKIQAKHIHFHGEVENAQVFMATYRVMAVPLLSGSGLRVKIIEAMAMGKCVVTTPVGAEGIDARHGKEIIIADEPEHFARSCKNLCSDPAQAERIGENAKAFAHSRFDKKTIAEKLFAYYQKLLGND